MNDVAAPRPRHTTTAVQVGSVTVGGGAPVVVQSMTNTDTADVDGTVRQVAALARAGSEIVRITVDRNEAAAAVPHIKERLLKMGVTTPIVGDFHYIGHKLLADHPACAESLDKYRINPGNVASRRRRTAGSAPSSRRRSSTRSPCASAPTGSLDQELLTHLMDENAKSPEPADVRAVTREAMVQSALLSAARAKKWACPRSRIILSRQGVGGAGPDRGLYRSGAPLGLRDPSRPHRGRHGSKGIVASSAAMGILLQQGIGDSARIASRSPAATARWK